MTEENTPEKASIAAGAASPASAPGRSKESETESSASYIANGHTSPPSDAVAKSTQPSGGSGSGSGVLVLVVLAAVVGALVSLYVVRESPWLAQKILKEQKAQALEEATDRPAEVLDSAEKGAIGAPKESAVAESPAEPVDSARFSSAPIQAALPLARLDPLVAQRIAQVQQWSVMLRSLRAGPKDPSVTLHTILTAPRTAPAVPVISDRPLKTAPPTVSPPSAAPEGSAAASLASDTPVVDPFGERLGRWFDGAVDATGHFLASLVRIQQVEEPNLVGQSQAFFAQVDERVQSHLLSARLLLMQEQPQLASEELAAVLELLTTYYDPVNAQLNGLKGDVSALRVALKDPA